MVVSVVMVRVMESGWWRARGMGRAVRHVERVVLVAVGLRLETKD